MMTLSEVKHGDLVVCVFYRAEVVLYRSTADRIESAGAPGLYNHNVIIVRWSDVFTMITSDAAIRSHRAQPR